MNRLEYNVVEFASRWKQAFSPESVAAGKSLAKQKATLGKNYMKSTLSNNEGFKAKARQVATKKNFEIGDKIKGLQSSAKAQNAELFKGNSPDRLLNQNKNLRSYLENRKVKQGVNSNVLSKPYQAPKTIKRAPTGVNKAMANQRAVSNQKFGESIEKAATPHVSPIVPPTPSIPTPSRPLPPNPLPRTIPTPQVGTLSPANKPGLLSKIGGAIKRNPVAAGAGIGAVGAGIGYGIYRKMKSNNNRQK